MSLGKYIPYIFMEWVNVRENRHHTCDQYTQFMDTFTKLGYSPRDSKTLVPVSLASHTEWWDVVWFHKDAKEIIV